jgi:CRISPR-associated endoribonuclease Cas6
MGVYPLPHKYNLEIKAAVTGKVSLRIESGNHLHGMLFSLLADINPGLADMLHASQEKPFALWPVLKTDGSISVTLTTLSDEIASAVDKLTGDCCCMLGRRPVAVSSKKVCSLSVAELWNRAEKAGNIESLKINFLSPTSFRRAGKQWLFPDPDIVFQNVYLKATGSFGVFFRDNLTSPTDYSPQIMVSRYDLATMMTDYGRYKIIGFCGFCVYDCRRVKLAYQQQSLAFLSALADFTGIGYKTTMGMGRVESRLGRDDHGYV